MLAKLFLLFTIVPAIELYLLIQIGAHLGPLVTFALVVATGAIGASLARAEGVRVVREWQQALARGEVPQDGVVSSALVLLGGVFLITPGVLTDCVGLALLIPAVRRPVARMLMRQVERSIAAGKLHVVQSYSWQARAGGTASDRGPFGVDVGQHNASEAGAVITVEGETVTEQTALPRPPRVQVDSDG